MRTWSADCDGPAKAAWALMARPDAWPQWAPHFRGAWGLGAREVREGAVGAARLLGVVPVPAVVVDKRPGRSWTWWAAPGVQVVHRVEPRPGGCTVSASLSAPGPLEPALALVLGPVFTHSLHRLARIAAG
ncbi:MAG TPA: SRPBCC family protein [Solirubrobacteraceae bacterium]